MAKYKIEFDREACIGALMCEAVAPKLWPKSDDGKVDLAGGTFNENTKKWELIIEMDEKEFRTADESAHVCPVDVIVITKISD